MSSSIDVHDQAAFDALQAKLVPLWRSIERFNQDPQTIVVVPSAEVDFPLSGSEMQAYEERYLFLLLLLRQPNARLVYVTGQAIHPSIVDYYLDLMPGVISSHARRRLFLVSPLEGSPRPLTHKLLDRPRLLERIRDLIPDPDRAHLVPFATTWKDRELAMRLGIPMYGADPVYLPLGTKSRGRELFAASGTPLPYGFENLHTEDELIRAICEIRRARPTVRTIILKLNEGVSGVGNATLDVASLSEPDEPGAGEDVRRHLPSLRTELADLGYERFIAKLAVQGGVAEERIEAAELRSPSVQLRITPLGKVELLSTHDQLLGGASGQIFLGSRFPADTGYSLLISREAAKVGERLAEIGVLGRFAIDFVVARDNGEGWRIYAIELNLRKGGTTHPFLTLQFLTDGTYDADAGVFVAPNGTEKHFVASDHVESPGYRVFTADDLFHLALIDGLHFDQTRQVGSVFHMMSALPEYGRVGVTAVGNDAADAEERYRAVLASLDRAAADAAEPGVRP